MKTNLSLYLEQSSVEGNLYICVMNRMLSFHDNWNRWELFFPICWKRWNTVLLIPVIVSRATLSEGDSLQLFLFLQTSFGAVSSTSFFGTHEKPLGASFNKLLRLLLRDNLWCSTWSYLLLWLRFWDRLVDYRYVMFPGRRADMYSNSVGCIYLQK